MRTCVQGGGVKATAYALRTRGETSISKDRQNFAYVLYGWPLSLFEVIEFYVFVGLTDVDSRLLFLLKTEHNIESILCLRIESILCLK